MRPRNYILTTFLAGAVLAGAACGSSKTPPTTAASPATTKASGFVVNGTPNAAFPTPNPNAGKISTVAPGPPKPLQVTGTPSSTPLTIASSAASLPIPTPQPYDESRWLNPPDLYAKTGSQYMDGDQGKQYWMLLNGLAAGVAEDTFRVPKTPLPVTQGEDVSFEWQHPNSDSDKTLQQFQLSVYPAQGNVINVATKKGVVTEFTKQTDPVIQPTDIPLDNLHWKADGLKPGQYFIVVEAHWSNPTVPDQPRYCNYSFMIEVK